MKVCGSFIVMPLRWLSRAVGILFLNTNRVSDFDDAFASRIHLHIKYRPLNEQQRSMIWRNLLSPSIAIAWGDETVKRLGGRYDLNGREIKNLIKTARELANFQKVPFSESHIETVDKLNHHE